MARKKICPVCDNPMTERGNFDRKICKSCDDWQVKNNRRRCRKCGWVKAVGVNGETMFCSPATNEFECKACYRARKLDDRRYRVARRRRKGLCEHCEQPAAPNDTLCVDHRARRQGYHDKRKASKSPDLCARCLSSPPEPGYANCRQCREDEATYRRTTQGLNVCIECQQRPTVPGRKRCADCLEEHRNRRKAA